MKKHLLKFLLTFVFALSIGLVNAQVTLPHYEAFDYTAAANLGDQTNWTNLFSGDEVIVTSSSLSYPGLASPTGNAISFGGGGFDPQLNFAAISSGPVYFSFIFKVTDQSAVTDLADGGYFVFLGSTSSAYDVRLWVRANPSAVSGTYDFGYGDAGSAPPVTPGTYNVGDIVFVVGNYNVTNGDWALWINPASSSFGGTEPTATISGTETSPVGSLAYFTFRQDSDGETPSVEIDELRIANTWADVTPTGIDVTAPVATWDPINTTTGVAIDKVITITFDEAIRDIATDADFDNTTVDALITSFETVPATTSVTFDATIDVTNQIITITPGADLAYATEYTLTLAAVEDASDNATTGETITFTTQPETDKDSKVVAPVTQVAAATIESTQIDSFPVFAFTISDLGTADGLDTKVTQLTLKTGPNNTFDFENDNGIAGGYLISEGGISIPFAGEPVTTPNSIEITFALDALTIPDGEDSTYTVYLLLDTEIADGKVIQFMIDANAHGFVGDPTGSEFTADFGADVIGNDITINVTATELQFTQQPTNTFVGNNVSDVIVAATDLNGNIDIDYVTDISITAAGATLVGTPVSATPVAGVSTFSTLSFSDEGTGVILTAASGTLTNGTSTAFAILNATPTINDIQSNTSDGDASNYNGKVVTSSGIVTAIDGSNYWVQDGDGAYNGIIFYDSGNAGSLTVGDDITFEGEVDEYNNLTEIVNVSSLTINSGGNTLPNASIITTAGLVEDYESVLVTIVNTEITNEDAGYGEFVITDGSGDLNVDDAIYAHSAVLNDDITITGVGTYSFGAFKLLPRSASDIVSATATVGSDVYTVDQGGLTITDIPLTTTLAAFKTNIEAADTATFEVFDANGTDIASVLDNTKLLIVTAADGITKATFTITVNATLLTDATVSSSVYTVDNGLETITNIPFSTTLATFESNISPALGATFETYETNGTTVATNLASGYKLIGTAEDASTKTYTITLDAASTDATLSDLTVDGTTVTGFAPGTLSYNVELTFGTTTVPTVVAVENHPFANAVVTPAVNVTGTELERTTTIVVTAEDGSTELTYSIIFSVGAETGDLIISEYIEGGGNNRAIEIYNPNATSVDLNQYEVQQSHNGTGWGVDGDGDIEYELPLTGTLAAGEVYVIANADASAEILAIADITLAYGLTQGAKVLSFTGDDALGLFKNDVLVDVIGIPTEDPGTGWDVAGTQIATVDHTLLRKRATTVGNTDWASSAGTTPDNSEWKVKDVDYIANLGLFTPFGTEALVTSSVYTVNDGLETITNVPFSASLATFESNISGTDGATFETYEGDGSTVATDLATGYKVIVTAEDGVAEKTYTITLNAANTDATLSDIRIDGGFLSGFDSAIFDYVKELDAGTTVTPTVTATPTYEFAQVDIEPATDVTSDTEAERTTTITVTAEDDVTELIYTVLFNVAASTGINDLTAGFKIYPNPSTGLFTLEMNNVSNDKYSIEVYDVIGKMIYKSNITESITNINLTHMNAGLYYVSVNKGEERNITKIMIQ